MTSSGDHMGVVLFGVGDLNLKVRGASRYEDEVVGGAGSVVP